MKADLFTGTEHAKPPRAKPRVMMHVIDAGDGVAQFQCNKCGHKSEWLEVETVTEAKRGEPCPHCNK